MAIRSGNIDKPRRQLLLAAGAGAFTAAFTSLGASAEPVAKPRAGAAQAAGTGVHKLPPLPYAESALAPGISAETVALHHGKHHRGYIDKLNELLVDDPRRGQSLEELVRSTHANPKDEKLFNNAAQAWNHAFYWNSLNPDGGGKPSGDLARAIDRDFGSFPALRDQLAEAATSQFGSGWAWLVERAGKLSVMKTGNADNPLATDGRPLLTIDVWEHAYYVDYRNRRADHVAAVIDGLLDWRFAARNLAG